MKAISIKRLAEFCNGKLVAGDADGATGDRPRFLPFLQDEIKGIVTDSRKDVAQKAFVAIKGENFDGQAFVREALGKGAACVVVSDREGWEKGLYGDRAILTDDTLTALGDIAAAYLREEMPGMRRIAVTGSVGKTTTKEFIHAVLASEYKAEKTPLSHNNEIGLPSTALSLPDDTEIFVAEMGMRGSGQIRYLENIVRPEAAVITTIGNAHLELLGSRENILKAKMEICLAGARLPAGKPFRLVVNGDNDLLGDLPRLREIAAGYGAGAPGSSGLEIVTFGQNSSADYRATEAICGENGINYLLICPEGNFHVSLPLQGEHNVYNTLAAIAAGGLFGIGPEKAIAALKRYAEECGGENSVRQRIVKLAGGRIVLIDDAYNAGPESMPASLSVLGGIKADIRIAALGDMVELGPRSPEFHREIGKIAAATCDRLFTVGEKSQGYIDGWRESKPADDGSAKRFSDTEAAFSAISRYLDKALGNAPGKSPDEARGEGTAAVLVKGSHIMHMDRISRLLEEKYK